MTKRRFALAVVLGLLVATADVHGQTFTAQIQQFWNMLRTGALQLAVLNTQQVRVPNTLLTTGSVTAMTFPSAQLSGTESFALTFGAGANAGDPSRGDLAAVWGWNAAGDGSTPRVAGEPAIMWRWENYFRPGSTACNTAAHGCVESHLQWLDSTGAVWRPIGFQGIDSPANATLVFQDDAVSILTRDGVNQNFKFSTGASGGTMQLFAASIFQKEANNSQFIKQINAGASRYTSLIYTSNSDDIVLGDNAANGSKHLFLLSSTGAQIRTLQTNALSCATNCGTSATVVGTDTSGTITMGATGVPASGFILTFGDTWAAAPHCTFWMTKAGMVTGKKPIIVVTTTGQATVTTDGTAPGNSDTYDYECAGN